METKKTFKKTTNSQLTVQDGKYRNQENDNSSIEMQQEMDTIPEEEKNEFNEANEWEQAISNHLPTNICQDYECGLCGVRDCPFGCELHYHHDHCPSCCFADK